MYYSSMIIMCISFARIVFFYVVYYSSMIIMCISAFRNIEFLTYYSSIIYDIMWCFAS